MDFTSIRKGINPRYTRTLTNNSSNSARFFFFAFCFFHFIFFSFLTVFLSFSPLIFQKDAPIPFLSQQAIDFLSLWLNEHRFFETITNPNILTELDKTDSKLTRLVVQVAYELADFCVCKQKFREAVDLLLMVALSESLLTPATKERLAALVFVCESNGITSELPLPRNMNTIDSLNSSARPTFQISQALKTKNLVEIERLLIDDCFLDSQSKIGVAYRKTLQNDSNELEISVLVSCCNIINHSIHGEIGKFL